MTAPQLEYRWFVVDWRGYVQYGPFTHRDGAEEKAEDLATRNITSYVGEMRVVSKYNPPPPQPAPERVVYDQQPVKVGGYLPDGTRNCPGDCEKPCCM